MNVPLAKFVDFEQFALSRYEDIQQAFVGYVYGDSTCGQRALYQMGQTGIPIFNVNNNCATGSVYVCVFLL